MSGFFPGAKVAALQLCPYQLLPFATEGLFDVAPGSEAHVGGRLGQRYSEFPEPVLKLDMGHVWNWPDVEKWTKKASKLPLRSDV